MPKTDRILGYLPLTFRANADPSALRSVIGAFGGELQDAENSLAAMMRAHWVDFADSGEQRIADLACIGALYGLAPRRDESVEEYREHLKRYVKTFLGGTATVQGLLRVAAETLHLHIDDDFDSIDAWWERPDEPVTKTALSGADAATKILGVAGGRWEGADASPAVVTGPVIEAPLDLRENRLLWLTVDGGSTVPVDVTDAAADPLAVELEEVVAAINESASTDGALRADATNGRLRLTSVTNGPSALVEVADGPEDAAPTLLGLPPRTYEGQDATAATVVGTADLSTPTDLTQLRYLRIDVDGNQLAEIDAAAAAGDPAAVSIEQITEAINAALGIDVAFHDGQFITVASPTSGAAGYIAVLAPAAQDATRALLGPVEGFTFGTDAGAARVTGSIDLGLGADLAAESTIRLAVDDRPAVSVDVAGADPSSTLPGEIVTSLNAALGATVADHDGRFLSLRSPTVGAGGVLVLEEVEGDASDAVLGTPTRSFRGQPTSTAALTSPVDLRHDPEHPLNLLARNAIVVAVDGGPPVEIDLGTHANDRTDVRLDELAAAINAAIGVDIATDDGAHLILVSPTDGAAGAIEVFALTTTTSHRFLSHAEITDDASTRLFGFTSGRATGSDASGSRVSGVNDLLGGVDLQDDRFLRISIDGAAPVEVDCAGPRPRATTVDEVVAAVNLALDGAVASTDGHLVTIVSPTTGAGSAISLQPSRSQDAVEALGLPAGLTRGLDATGVSFAGIPALSAGIDLVAQATVSIGVDGAGPVEILVGEAEPVTRNLSQLVGSINSALSAQIASHDGTRLFLTSPSRGAGAGIEIATSASGADVGFELFGIQPRTYVGSDATPAVATGSVDLGAAEPLGLHRFLGLAVDGGEAVTVDLADRAEDPSRPTPAEIATAVNVASPALASVVGGRLRLESPSNGSAGRIDISHAVVGDARDKLFGDVDMDGSGVPARPASLTGEADLLIPADLSTGSVIRLALDDRPAVEIDVAGPVPGFTMLSDIVAAIDEVVPGVAAATAEGRLRLTSRSAGPNSTVEVQALRRLEIQEYPPEEQRAAADVVHGSRFVVDNRGASTSTFDVELFSPSGTVGPLIAALSKGWSIRIDETLNAGGQLTIALDEGELAATIDDIGGSRRVDPDSIQIVGDQEMLLRLDRGANNFVFLECDSARFDAAVFDSDEFAGGPCTEIGVFNASRFSSAPRIRTEFAPLDNRFTASRLTATWDEHRAGSLNVNLPARLDERYGARFGEGRFGSSEAEVFAGVVTEPNDDPQFVTTAIGDESGLIVARIVPRVPIGWEAVTMPFRDPEPLTLGTADQAAKIFLSEEGLGDDFLELEARAVGSWANEVTISARQSGPAIYDLEVRYPGGRFENARAVVAGWPPIDTGEEPLGCPLVDRRQAGPDTDDALPTLASQLLAPGPIGVLMASAAGVRVAVTRDRTWSSGP